MTACRRGCRAAHDNRERPARPCRTEWAGVNGIGLIGVSGYNPPRFSSVCAHILLRTFVVNKLLSRLSLPKLSLSRRSAVMVAVLGLGAALSLSSHALTDKQKKDVEGRIKPAGSVCLEGDSTCGAAVAAAGGEPRSGQAVYDASCNMCHGAGVGGAPKTGDKAAWSARIAQGKDILHTHAIQGIRAMPPKGTCMSCSDDEVMSAVDFMVSKSK